MNICYLTIQGGSLLVIHGVITYHPYKWPYTWLVGVIISPASGVNKNPTLTMRGPPPSPIQIKHPYRLPVVLLMVQKSGDHHLGWC